MIGLNKPGYYRELAESYEADAEQPMNADHRDHYLHLADAFRRLADSYEAAQVRNNPTGPGRGAGRG